MKWTLQCDAGMMSTVR